MTITINTIRTESGNLYEVTQSKYENGYAVKMYACHGGQYGYPERELDYATLKEAEATMKRWAKRYN